MEIGLFINEILLELVYVADLKESEDGILNRIIGSYLRKLNCFMAGVLKYEDKELKLKKVLPLVFEKNDSWSLINENYY